MRPFCLMIFLFLIACSNSDKEKKKVITKEIHDEVKVIQDTVLERNNPNSLDLAKHQLFIDTTRNSVFYQDLIEWNPHEYDTKTVSTYLTELNKISKSRKINFGNFPKLFTSIHKVKNEFLLYDRCDGIDPRYELRDSAFIFYGPLESDAETINKVHHVSNNQIKIQLNSFKAKTPTGVSELEISKTEYEGIYFLKYSNENYLIEKYVVAVNDIKKFDLVVNNCPTMKMEEYHLFY